MNWPIVTLALALGVNNAIAAVALGAAGMTRRHQFRTACVFALFEALMPVVGVVLGAGAAGLLGRHAKALGVLVLAAAGVYALLPRKDTKSPKQTPTEQPSASQPPPASQPSDAYRSTAHPLAGTKLFILAIALSLDNLTVGFGLGMLHATVGTSAVVFGVVSLVMTWTGLELGRLIGRTVKLPIDRLTGLVLLITAGLMWVQ